jgi:hypothetical protein
MRYFVLFVALGLLTGCKDSRTTNGHAAATSVQAAPKPNPSEIIDVGDWMKIQADWRQSAIEAEHKWMNRFVRVTFEVWFMGKSERTNQFYFSGYDSQVSAIVTDKAEEVKFSKVRKGDTITIVARVSEARRNEEFIENFYNIILSDASLESIKQAAK